MRLTLFLILIHAPFSMATINPVPPSYGNLHLGFTETYFRSEENFSAKGGGFDNLPNGGLYQEFNSHILGDWDLNSNWRLRSNFEFSFVQTETSAYTKENSHPDKVGLGVEYWKNLNRTPLIIYSQVQVPIYKPDLNSEDAFGSDGAFNLDIGLFTRPRFGNFIGNLGVGYKWRSENLSHLLPWTVGASYSFGVGQIGGGIRGFQTVIKDSGNTANQTERSSAIANGQGGSLAYLSVGPQLQQLYVNSRWGLIKGLDLSTDFAYDINGKSSSKGIYAGVGLHWLIDFSGLANGGKSSESFEVESDRYRENLFKSSDPSNAPKPRKPMPRQKSIKQLLDETEESLEP